MLSLPRLARFGLLLVGLRIGGWTGLRIGGWTGGWTGLRIGLWFNRMTDRRFGWGECNKARVEHVERVGICLALCRRSWFKTD